MQNRVLRLYSGGSGIDRLCGNPNGVDTRFPENWIASCIEGNGRAYHSPGHGISKITVDGEIRLFPDYLKEHAAELLGKKHLKRYGTSLGTLVKLLDSAEELPLQVHPSRADAKKYLHSEYGKTEAWLVLATREIKGEKPYLLIGFNRNLDKELFVRETLAGKLDKSRKMLNKLPVAPGDVVIIAGGLPHAIGPGVTMVEVMEPSDWVLIPEIECCGVSLNEKQRFIGLPPETAVNLFDFTPMNEAEIRKKLFPVSHLIRSTEAGSFRVLISPEDCKLFSAYELTLNGTWEMENPASFAIGVVVEGTLDFDGTTIKQGGNFFLPYAIKKLKIQGHGRLMLIRPPQVEK